MTNVTFYDEVEDSLLKFAVIIAKSNGKWVLCKHKDRTTYEFPGGHRELSEDILATAKRELFEETGAVEYQIKQLCVYSVCTCNNETDTPDVTYGMLYYADITEFERLPDYEIEQIYLMDQLPNNWTYPDIQPKLLEKIDSMLSLISEKGTVQ